MHMSMHMLPHPKYYVKTIYDVSTVITLRITIHDGKIDKREYKPSLTTVSPSGII